MNITFFTGNEVLNIFSCNNFFEKTQIFGEKEEKNVLGDITTFGEKGSSYAKNEYNLFYRKLDAKYFQII